jgi:hypothetical protein
MDGEAILGSLPTHYDRIVQVSSDTGCYNAYINRRTGQTEIQDPRLAPLPDSWRLKLHGHEHLRSWAVNDKTGRATQKLMLAQVSPYRR